VAQQDVLIEKHPKPEYLKQHRNHRKPTFLWPNEHHRQTTSRPPILPPRHPDSATYGAYFQEYEGGYHCANLNPVQINQSVRIHAWLAYASDPSWEASKSMMEIKEFSSNPAPCRLK